MDGAKKEKWSSQANFISLSLMIMASDHWPTYVILAIYIVLTCLVTFVAKKKNSDPDDTNSHVSKHFLGSKSMGPVLLVYVQTLNMNSLDNYRVNALCLLQIHDICISIQRVHRYEVHLY